MTAASRFHLGLIRACRRFTADRSANVAVIFGLTMLPLLGVIGAAVDYSRAAALVTKVQQGTDAAALNLCQSTSTSQADMTAVATNIMSNFLAGPPTIDVLNSTSNPRSITLTAHASYPTTFLKIFNVPILSATATSACSAAETFYEIALVLDTTGSMAESSGSQSKIQALQAAANNFVSYMFANASPGHLKISLVPFAATVKVDPSTYATASWLDQNGNSSLHWQNITAVSGSGFRNRFDLFGKLGAVTSGWGWGGCVESLPYPLNVQDGAPSAGNTDSYFLPYLNPDEVGTTVSGSQDVTSRNSYIDDGTAPGSSSCDSTNANQSKRLGQACKYVSPANARTSQGGPNYLCSPRPLTRLTATQSTLTSEINALAAAGSTNIHEGVMWGWRTLSPTSVFADGAAYTKQNTKKVIVLMTDGTNQWLADTGNPVTQSFYSAYGYFNNADGSKPNARLAPGNANPATSADGRAAIDALTALACTNAKAAGITVYTIGFSVPSDPIDAAGQSLLANCASSSANYYPASDSNALNTAFNQIGQGISQLRLTR